MKGSLIYLSLCHTVYASWYHKAGELQVRKNETAKEEIEMWHPIYLLLLLWLVPPEPQGFLINGSLLIRLKLIFKANFVRADKGGIEL